MAYFINHDCIGCAFCQNECPVLAISYDGDKYRIDPELCIQCGKCSEACLMDAIEDTQAPRTEKAPHDPIRKQCDFAVVGGGAAGLIAAARYAELTGKKVVVLEKNRKPGGGGYFAVGLTPCNTQWEKDAGLQDCVEERVQKAMEQTRGKLDPALLTNLFTALGDVFDWLCTWAPVEECFALAPNPFNGQLSVGAKDQARGAGRFITTHILPYFNKLGVEVLTETEATRLHLDENGRICGITARDGGGEVEITCKQCLLCTGSLIRSERIKKLLPDFADTEAKRYAHDMPGLTGDGLTLAEKAGVHLDEESIVLAFVGCMPVAFEEGAFQQGERGDCMRVNLLGRRWCNELMDGKAMAEQLMYQPKSVSYTVMDSTILESAQPPVQTGPKAGAPGGGAPAGGGGEGFPYPGGVPDFAVTRREKTPNDRNAFRALAEKLGQQTVICGSTLEELAARMGVPAETFRQTVLQYNSCCAAGDDAEFHKPASHLRPIQNGPFFAIRNYLYLDGVFGGLDVSPNMEVLDQGRTVKGLYAAGDIACGRYINDRLHKTEVINDYSWAVAGGFMAANHAASETTF